MIGFDLNTLFLVTIYIEALLGLLLLFVWVQNSAITAVAWWGNAHLLRAGSVAIFGLYGSVPDVISIDIANTVLFLAFAATWTGTRVLGHRRPQLLGIIAGPAIWLVLSRVPVIAESMDLRALISSGIITAYTWLAAYELWRDRAEPLLSRWPAIFMLFAHGALFVLRTPLSTMREWSPDLNAFGNVWMTILSHEELLFTVAVAFIMLAMAKERGEMRHKTAAMVDPLTSIANRRAFLEGGDMVAALAAERSCPVAVLLIDLDQFKSINDRYGHFAGDRVLQIFAETASRLITPADVLGRLGGEEFAVILYDADKQRASAVAENIRAAFAAAAKEVDGWPVAATLSVGVAVSADGMIDMPAMLAEADKALYRAKEIGRNRVEVAALDFVLRLDASTPSLRIPQLASGRAL